MSATKYIATGGTALDREKAETKILEIASEYEGDAEELLHTVFRTVRNSEKRDWKP